MKKTAPAHLAKVEDFYEFLRLFGRKLHSVQQCQILKSAKYWWIHFRTRISKIHTHEKARGWVRGQWNMCWLTLNVDADSMFQLTLSEVFVRKSLCIWRISSKNTCTVRICPIAFRIILTVGCVSRLLFRLVSVSPIVLRNHTVVMHEAKVKIQK